MPDKAKPPKPRKVRKYHIPAKDRDFLTGNLALLIKAALPVGEALGALEETSKSAALKKALRQMQHDIDDGMSLSVAMERSGVAGRHTITLVQLGEESGNLVQNLLIAAEQEKKQRQLRAELRSALMYPAFVLTMTLIIGLGIAWFLLPKLSDTFSQLGLKLPLISRVMINFGVFLKENGVWAVPTFIGAIFALMLTIFVIPGTRRIGQWIMLHAPGVSRLVKEVEVARFGHMFGMLLQAGLSVTESFKLLYGATGQPAYRKLYRDLYTDFEEGFNFKSSLKAHPYASKLLPPSIQQMLIAGERSGSLPETLKMIGDIYDERAETSTKNLETIIEPVLLVIVWGGVLAIAIAVILPIYSLMGGLQR